MSISSVNQHLYNEKSFQNCQIFRRFFELLYATAFNETLQTPSVKKFEGFVLY